MRSNDGTYSDVTFYKIEVGAGWQQGWLVSGSPRLRWLRCKTYRIGPTSANNQYHGWYITGTGSDDFEIAYCELENDRAFATGAMWQLYPEPGPLAWAIHHNRCVPGSRFTWGLIQDASQDAERRFFNNTLSGNFSNGGLAIGYGDGGGVTLDSSLKFWSNIIVNSGSGSCIHTTAFASGVDWGGNNTLFPAGGGSATSGSAFTIANWGANRNPSLDGNGIAQAAAEKGSGQTLALTPVHTDAGLRVPSSVTNVDRGHYQHGPVQPATDTWKITGLATSSDGVSTQSADFNVVVV